MFSKDFWKQLEDLQLQRTSLTINTCKNFTLLLCHCCNFFGRNLETFQSQCALETHVFENIFVKRELVAIAIEWHERLKKFRASFSYSVHYVLDVDSTQEEISDYYSWFDATQRWLHFDSTVRTSLWFVLIVAKRPWRVRFWPVQRVGSKLASLLIWKLP